MASVGIVAAVIVVRTSSATATAQLAAAVAELARPTDVVLLSGDLGAGKTTFTQGFGRGLGVTEQITSPTFTLLRSYEGRLTLHHLDIYRLTLDEVPDLGLNEMLDGDAVILIEWGDTIAPLLGADRLEVRLRLPSGDFGDDDREIEIEPVGRWAARDRALRTAVAPWLVEEGEQPC